METINHECYVSPEVAKLLREAGFDWECKEYYYNFTTTGWSLNFDDNFVNWNNWSERYISAPTLEVAQRWLRKVKQCYVHVYPMFSFEGTLEYYFVEVTYPSSCAIKQNEFNTYEEAQEAGIKKALEIINKGE